MEEDLLACRFALVLSGAVFAIALSRRACTFSIAPFLSASLLEKDSSTYEQASFLSLLEQLA